MISLVLEAYKSADQAAAGRCDVFLRKCESEARDELFDGLFTFVSLFHKTCEVFKEPVVIIGDEFSRFYDFKDVSEQAKDNAGCALDALQCIKEGRARGSDRLRGAVLLGTYGATVLYGRSTAFNVVSTSELPLLTLEEWRACVAQTAWRPDDRVLERMWELTRGHPSVLQTIATDLSTTAITSSAAFETYEGSSAFLDSVLTNKSVQANLRDLRRPASRDLRDSLIKTFLPSEGRVEAIDFDVFGLAGRLSSLGFLKALSFFSYEVASPLVRRILMERCLPEDFKGIIPFVAPRLKDGRLDVVEIIRLAAPAVVKAAMQSEMTKGPYQPHEVVYHLQLVLHLSAWLEGKAEVKSEVPRGASRTGFNITIVDSTAGNPSRGKSIILELTAHAKDSGDDSIPSHLDRCHEIYKLAISAVYCVHFTSQGETECLVPDKDHPTPLIHVRHDKEGEVLGLLVKVPGVEGLRSVARKKRKRAME